MTAFPSPGDLAWEAFICHTAPDDPRRASREITTVYLANHGTFTAYSVDVACMLACFGKRELIGQVRALWPDLFSRKELQALPAYVLATILRQSF